MSPNHPTDSPTPAVPSVSADTPTPRTDAQKEIREAQTIENAPLRKIAELAACIHANVADEDWTGGRDELWKPTIHAHATCILDAVAVLRDMLRTLEAENARLRGERGDWETAHNVRNDECSGLTGQLQEARAALTAANARVEALEGELKTIGNVLPEQFLSEGTHDSHRVALLAAEHQMQAQLIPTLRTRITELEGERDKFAAQLEHEHAFEVANDKFAAECPPWKSAEIPTPEEAWAYFHKRAVEPLDSAIALAKFIPLDHQVQLIANPIIWALDNWISNLRTRLTTLEEQLGEARKDGERLDWLNNQRAFFLGPYNSQGTTFDWPKQFKEWIASNAQLRAAIDAARRPDTHGDKQP